MLLQLGVKLGPRRGEVEDLGRDKVDAVSLEHGGFVARKGTEGGQEDSRPWHKPPNMVGIGLQVTADPFRPPLAQLWLLGVEYRGTRFPAVLFLRPPAKAITIQKHFETVAPHVGMAIIGQQVTDLVQPRLPGLGRIGTEMVVGRAVSLKGLGARSLSPGGRIALSDLLRRPPPAVHEKVDLDAPVGRRGDDFATNSLEGWPLMEAESQ